MDTDRQPLPTRFGMHFEQVLKSRSLYIELVTRAFNSYQKLSVEQRGRILAVVLAQKDKELLSQLHSLSGGYCGREFNTIYSSSVIYNAIRFLDIPRRLRKISTKIGKYRVLSNTGSQSCKKKLRSLINNMRDLKKENVKCSLSGTLVNEIRNWINSFPSSLFYEFSNADDIKLWVEITAILHLSPQKFPSPEFYQKIIHSMKQKKKKEKEKDKENEEKKGKKKKKKEEKEEKDEDGGEDEEREAHEERSDRESYRRRSSVLSDEIPEILNYASHSLNTFFMESLSGAGPGENFQNFLFSSIQPEVPISHFDKFCESVEEISRKRSEINFVDLKGLERNLQQIEKDFEMGLSNAISRSKTLVATVESRISTALSEHRAIITTHSPSEWQAYDAQNQKATKLAKASLESNTRPYLEPICKHLSKGEIDEAYKEYLRQRDLSANSKSPSFYIYCSRLFHAGEAPRELSMKIVTNTIEMNVQDTQMFRSVAYFMLEIGLITEAIILFRKVQDKAPAEPQSFLDLGLALYMDVRNKIKEGQDKEKVLPQLKEAISEIGKVITGNWVDRFREIEWPAIIYINWMVGYGLHHGMGDLWPDSQVTRTFHVPNLSLGLFVSMGWDTDHTDIDLHVYEPDRNHVYYSNKCDRLSRDFTQGYGPECYTNKFPTCGIYTISAHYYASSQKSSSTGTTSCVLWSLKNLGKFDSEEILFQMVRLDTNQSQLTVMMVAIIRD